MRRSHVPGIGPSHKSPIPGTDPMQALFLNLPTYRHTYSLPTHPSNPILSSNFTRN